MLTLSILLFKANKDIKLVVMLSYGMLLLSFSVLTVQLYYFLVIFAFSPLLIYFFRRIRNTRNLYMAFVVTAIACSILNWNIVTLLSGTLPVRNMEMAEIVNADHTEDNEVVNFCSYDTGIHVLTEHLPLTKYHFMPNIQSKDIREEQARLLRSSKAKYLARRIGCVKKANDYYDLPIPPEYELIYNQQELFRYRFLTNPMNYLWNLGYPQAVLKHVMTEPKPQRSMLYKRIDQ